MTLYFVVISTMNIWVISGNVLNLFVVFFFWITVWFLLMWVWCGRFFRCVFCEKWLMIIFCYCRYFLMVRCVCWSWVCFLFGIKAVNLKILVMSLLLFNCMVIKFVLWNRMWFIFCCCKGNSGCVSWRWWSKMVVIFWKIFLMILLFWVGWFRWKILNIVYCSWKL